MNVGRRVDYAVRVLSYLAVRLPDKPVSGAEIGGKQDIPPHYLSKIMKDLVVAGLVKSYIGSKGGFSLARPAAIITIKDAYEAVEGPLTLMECTEHGQLYCWFSPVCSQISVWQKAQNLIASYLNTVSISDIADEGGLKNRLIHLESEARHEKRKPVNGC